MVLLSKAKGRFCAAFPGIYLSIIRIPSWGRFTASFVGVEVALNDGERGSTVTNGT